MRYRGLLLLIFGLVIFDGAALAEVVVCRTLPFPDPPIRQEQLGYSVAASGTTTAFGANLGDRVFVSDGTTKVGMSGDQFGFAIALTGDTLVVGAPTADTPRGNDAGAVYTFRKVSGVWEEDAVPMLTPADGAAGAQFGFTVALHGNTLAVGAAMDGEGGTLSGAVYVFERMGSEWKFQEKFLGARPFDGLGSAIALGQGFLAAGAPFVDGPAGGNQGAVHLITRGDTWKQKDVHTQVLVASKAKAGDQFGYAVSIEATTLAVGARRGDLDDRVDAGWVAVFSRAAENRWNESAKLTAGNPRAGELFGNAVALSGGSVLVGAFMADEGNGAAYLFEEMNGVWSLLKRMEPPNEQAFEKGGFGFAVAMSGDTIAIGAFLANGRDGFGCEVVPEPLLSIDGVKQKEGSSDTTDLTFTVKLSAPAGPGGVRFNIATEDGTADGQDYDRRKPRTVMIPEGESTFDFKVPIKGDTAPEPDETFMVKVTIVSGASFEEGEDGEVVGTIVNDDFNLSINDVSMTEGSGGKTFFTFTVLLFPPAGEEGVIFDIATAPGTAEASTDYGEKSLKKQEIPARSSSYFFTVPVKGDTTPEAHETFFVDVTNVTGAIVTDSKGQGTIVNDDAPTSLTPIHGLRPGGLPPLPPGAPVGIEGIVTASFQGNDQLQGFFLQEEDAHADDDPLTSEGIFVFCGQCPSRVTEGQRVRVHGPISEPSGRIRLEADTEGSVVVDADAGNQSDDVTPTPVDLPVNGDADAFYGTLEGMLVRFVDTLTVAEYSDLARFGQIELFEGTRPRQFTETAPPNLVGYGNHLKELARRRVILDDDDDLENSPLARTDGLQFIFHPQANGGFSVGTQGADFFRGGDQVNGLTGVLHRSFAGLAGTDAWRVRPTAASLVTFTVANPRPSAPPEVGGAIKAASVNLLNYFTTIDTTPGASGPCGPAKDQECQGADSLTELDRQRKRVSILLCQLNADVVALTELENTLPTGTINDLLGAVNSRCGGANPYAFVNTGTLGNDVIRVALIYRSATLAPVGLPLLDLDPIHARPPTAQTFNVIHTVFGELFTVIANHFQSKDCDAAATGANADRADGQGCYVRRRNLQATRLLTWIAGTVLPEANDQDLLLLGDFNSYSQEAPVTKLTGGGFTDLASTIPGPSAYSYLFDGQLGRLDYAFASSSLASKVTGIGIWHINADEAGLLDYNDETRDTGEAAFEEKPDGSALLLSRTLFQKDSPFRASDHDPVLVGLFPVADLAVTKVGSRERVTAGTNLTYTITVKNAGPRNAASVSLHDTLPGGTSFVSLSSPAGWACNNPPVGAGGTVSCSTGVLATSALATFTLVVKVAASVVGGTVLYNTATVASPTLDSNPGNESGTAITEVIRAVTVLSGTKRAYNEHRQFRTTSYFVVLTNSGTKTQGNNHGNEFTDVLPEGLILIRVSATSGGVSRSRGTVAWNGELLPGQSVFINIDARIVAAAPTTISNQGTIVYDADGDGTNDASVLTDDPNVAGSADPTSFQVEGPAPFLALGQAPYVPTLDSLGLTLPALLLVTGGPWTEASLTP